MATPPHDPRDVVQRFLQQRAHHLGFLRARCRDDALAEDLFQDLAIAVIEGRGRYRSQDGDVDAWVRGIARNLVRAHRRRQAAAPHRSATIEELVDRAYDDRAADEGAELAERMRRLRGCLARLGAQARDLLRLRYEERLPSSAAAQRLGRSVNAVDTMLCRVRAALLACLRRDGSAP